jgi:hypothetical protein
MKIFVLYLHKYAKYYNTFISDMLQIIYCDDDITNKYVQTTNKI